MKLFNFGSSCRIQEFVHSTKTLSVKETWHMLELNKAIDECNNMTLLIQFSFLYCKHYANLF